jgi:hypothetical protein
MSKETLREVVVEMLNRKQEKLSLEQIQSIVDKVSFMDRTFRVLEKGDGFLLQMEYMEADVTKPGSEPVKQGTRKWYVSPFMTESEIVETCWACVCRSQLHVASEYFSYQGRRVYSQHFDINGRIELCDEEKFDVRKAP